MASGGSSRNQEWCGRDGYQLVDNSEEHHCLLFHPPLLESIPLETCKHGCNAAGSTVVSLHKTRCSLLDIF